MIRNEMGGDQQTEVGRRRVLDTGGEGGGKGKGKGRNTGGVI